MPNLVRFVTGLEVSEVAADVGHIVPDRLVDDYAAGLLAPPGLQSHLSLQHTKAVHFCPGGSDGD